VIVGAAPSIRQPRHERVCRRWADRPSDGGSFSGAPHPTFRDAASVFARYFVELSLGVDRVEDLLTRDAHTWLSGVAEQANRRGDDLLSDVGFGDRGRTARTVTIELGSAVRMRTKTLIPLHWSAVGRPELFPALDADLEIAPLGDGTQLALSARYAPPLGAVGRAIDRALLSRVAEATIKDFLDRVAEAIGAGDGADAVPVPAASR
jgi:hypothetical protein